jgi:hypothetical protein
MHDNTYKSLVEVDILLHNVSVVDNCDIELVLYLFQNPLLRVLHFCIQINLLLAHYTEALDCTAQYCTEVALCYTVAARYYMVVAQYYTVVAQCCMGLELG